MRYLRYKILFPILLLHLLAIPLLVYWILGLYERSAWKTQEQLADAFLNQVQQEIAVHQMATKDGLQIQRTLDRLYASHRFLSIEVFDAAGSRVAARGEIAPDLSGHKDQTRVQVDPGGEVLKIT